MCQPRLLLVHGCVVNGDATWAAQKPLADRFELVVPNRRGFPPGPDVEQVDFEDEAVWLEQFLEPGTHLVGHSYGGVIALLAAAGDPELLRSLTVIEPPAFAVARGNPAADEFMARRRGALDERPARPGRVPARLPRRVGAPPPPGDFSPELLQGARTLMVERYPWRRRSRSTSSRATPFPKLVVSGGHSEAFEARLRRARGAARRRASRAPGRRPRRPAARRAVQRAAAELRRARRTSLNPPRLGARHRARSEAVMAAPRTGTPRHFCPQTGPHPPCPVPGTGACLQRPGPLRR